MKYFLPLILLFVNISFCFAGMISFNVTDFKYIKKEAEKGNPYYQGVLANVYLRGNLCQKRDGQLAYKWATLAAEKNNPIGMSVLYSIYKVGMPGVPADIKKAENLSVGAFKQIPKLAEEGCPIAQYHYSNKFYSEKKYDESLKWLRKSAIDGNYSIAQDFLAHSYLIGTRSGIKKDKKLGLELYLKAAKQGYIESELNLAVLYYSGSYGIQKNLRKAMKWFQAAEKRAPEIAGPMVKKLKGKYGQESRR